MRSTPKKYQSITVSDQMASKRTTNTFKRLEKLYSEFISKNTGKTIDPEGHKKAGRKKRQELLPGNRPKQV